MSIGSNTGKLMDLDKKIKENLEDENTAMKEIYMELVDGLKQLRTALSQAKFEDIGEENADDIINPVKESINSFIKELTELEALDDRFAKIHEHSEILKNTLEELKNTLSIYNSSEKAVIDFNNNVLYIFKTTIQRDFEKDLDFNKRIEEALE